VGGAISLRLRRHFQSSYHGSINCRAAAACRGSSDNTSGPAPTTTATAASGTTAAASQACVDAAALKASGAELDQLDPPKAGKAGKAGIQAALDKVQANLAALKNSATASGDGQITELDGAVEALKTTVAEISGDSLVSALPTVVSDLKRIDTAWTALQQQIDQDCG